MATTMSPATGRTAEATRTIGAVWGWLIALAIFVGLALSYSLANQNNSEGSSQPARSESGTSTGVNPAGSN